ncbi:MAG: transglycosylase SLT domain-containing protein [Salinisphaeraceae bacterium]
MRLFTTLCALLLTTGAQALTPETARELFRDLEAAVARGELAQQQDALARLADYPLTPYLLADDLRRRLRRSPDPVLDDQIAAFLAEHEPMPPVESLRRAWLDSLSERGHWSRLLEQVRDDDGTAVQCHATLARIRLDRASAAELTAQGLTHWQVGRSQPEACDPVFAWLDQRGELTPDRIIERARLAVLADQTGLARYLARQLPEDRQGPIPRWLDAVANPGELRQIADLDGDIAVHVYKKLALRDLDGAGDILPSLAQRLDLDAGQHHEMQRWTALLHGQGHNDEALTWFAKLDPARTDDFARGWHVRSAIRQQAWDTALRVIEAMPAAQREEEEWRYWRARSLAATGRQEAAERLYAALAGERSYHGYLAADQLDLAYDFNRNPLSRDADSQRRLQAIPALQRARELRTLEREYPARAEWRLGTRELSPAMLEQAALLAHDWSWHPLAIITLADSDYWDDLNIRYPLHLRDAVSDAATTSGLDPALILAIMRTESLFMTNAHSPAGAIGLMQLMPATARRVAQDMGEARPGIADLETPATNLRLGTRYLDQMLERFDRQPALAMAAYNAGPHRVDRWLPEAAMPADIWVENIAYTETREYVKRAFSHLIVFRMRLDQPVGRLSDRMPPVPAARQLEAAREAADERES